MKKWIALLIGIACLSTLIITCPSAENHREAIKTVCNESLQESDNLLVSMLGSYLLDTIAQEMISTHNYFIFSTGSIGYDDESHLASIGILWHVFVLFDKNDLNNIIDQL